LTGYEGIEEANMVIANTAQWEQLILEMNFINNEETASFEETDIDFERFMVIAVILEVKFSLWYVEITDLEETEISVTFFTTETSTALSAISRP